MEQFQRLIVHGPDIFFSVDVVMAGGVFQIRTLRTYFIGPGAYFYGQIFGLLKDVFEISDKLLTIAFSIKEVKADEMVSSECRHADSIR